MKALSTKLSTPTYSLMCLQITELPYRLKTFIGFIYSEFGRSENRQNCNPQKSLPKNTIPIKTCVVFRNKTAMHSLQVKSVCALIIIVIKAAETEAMHI